ncbi:hypothetical protein [Evansella clarkii]|uniref:hypothetical protein n=1 Tax=Evansella clarkii TaxID=79879 RepID=UPI001473CE1F|nr:hypothetical protein [Evansella clarkii]
MGKYPKHEPCEMCGVDVIYGFSLCDDCDKKVEKFDETTGLYTLENGEVVDTTKHQY